MATPNRSERSDLVGGFLTVGRFVLVGVFTGVETVALVVWLALVGDAPTLSSVAVIGLGVLVVGLFLEHVLTDVAVNGLNLSFPVGSVALVSASEAALWALWLAIAERVGGLGGFLVASVALAVLLVPQHSVEDAVLRGRRPLSNVRNLGTVGFSLVEAAGATVWLLFVRRSGLVEARFADLGVAGVDAAAVGVGVLAFALFVEHVIGVEFSRSG